MTISDLDDVLDFRDVFESLRHTAEFIAKEEGPAPRIPEDGRKFGFR